METPQMIVGRATPCTYPLNGVLEASNAVGGGWGEGLQPPTHSSQLGDQHFGIQISVSVRGFKCQLQGRVFVQYTAIGLGQCMLEMWVISGAYNGPPFWERFGFYGREGAV